MFSGPTDWTAASLTCPSDKPQRVWKMVTAWDVYLVLQLNAIGGLFIAGGVLGVFFGGLAWLFGVIEAEPRVTRMGKRLVIAGVVSGVFAALLPSSQTAAAMILAPKLTSPEVLQPASAE